MKGILPLSFLIVLFITCNNPDRSSEIAKIDSLYTVLDTIAVNLKEVDTAGIKTRNTEYWDNINEIKKNYNGTPGDTAWTIVTQYGGIKKTFKKFLFNYHFWEKEIAFSKEQLDSLKYDVENNLITKEDFKKYFKGEEEAVNSLNQDIFFSIKNVDIYSGVFDTLNPKIIKVIETLKKEDAEIN